MDKKLVYKYKSLCGVRDVCNEAIELYQNPREDVTPAEMRAFTASLIKYYELAFEVLWKFLKHFLLVQYGKESLGSKTIFRNCLNLQIISPEQLDVLLEAVQQRNTTVHVYDNEVVKEQCQTIITNFSVISALIDQLDINKN